MLACLETGAYAAGCSRTGSPELGSVRSKLGVTRSLPWPTVRVTLSWTAARRGSNFLLATLLIGPLSRPHALSDTEGAWVSDCGIGSPSTRPPMADVYRPSSRLRTIACRPMGFCASTSCRRARRRWSGIPLPFRWQPVNATAEGLHLGDACRDYLELLEGRSKSYQVTSYMMDANIVPLLGQRLVEKLTRSQISQWHKEFATTARRNHETAWTQKVKRLDVGDVTPPTATCSS